MTTIGSTQGVLSLIPQPAARQSDSRIQPKESQDKAESEVVGFKEVLQDKEREDGGQLVDVKA